MSSLHCKSPLNRRNRRGFTLIEVMVSAVILGLVSFSLLAVLRAGDKLSMRARVNGAVASQLKARGSLLTAVPYADVAGLQGVWYYGTLASDPLSPHLPDVLLLPGDSVGTIPYLVYGQPLPGTSALRPLGKYLEQITISEPSVGILNIEYKFTWLDPAPLPGMPAISNITLNFSKYDPNLY